MNNGRKIPLGVEWGSFQHVVKDFSSSVTSPILGCYVISFSALIKETPWSLVSLFSIDGDEIPLQLSPLILRILLGYGGKNMYINALRRNIVLCS